MKKDYIFQIAILNINNENNFWNNLIYNYYLLIISNT